MSDLIDNIIIMTDYLLESEKKHFEESKRSERKSHIYAISKRVARDLPDTIFQYEELRDSLSALLAAIQAAFPEKKCGKHLSNAAFRAETFMHKKFYKQLQLPNPNRNHMRIDWDG